MPMDKKRYPVNWDEISKAVREKAGQKCQQCGAPNGVLVYRPPEKPETWILVPERVSSQDVVRIWGGRPITEVNRTVRIVLTVHHIGIPKEDGTPGDRHDKMDCREDNLIALCQRCHWKADWDIHYAKAVRAKRERMVAAGQLELPIDIEEVMPK